jgi:hypothetical protein
VFPRELQIAILDLVVVTKLKKMTYLGGFLAYTILQANFAL